MNEVSKAPILVLAYDKCNTKRHTLGQVTISNDGATIMKLLDIVHPAAKTLVDIARSQDAEVGDGTTSVVLLAGELLKEVKGYIEEGVSPHVIIKGYRQAARLVRDLCVHTHATIGKH
jgi:T-complex protein 1 subunit eta